MTRVEGENTKAESLRELDYTAKLCVIRASVEMNQHSIGWVLHYLHPGLLIPTENVSSTKLEANLT